MRQPSKLDLKLSGASTPPGWRTGSSKTSDGQKSSLSLIAPHSIEKLFELALAIDQHVRQLALQYPAMEPAQRAAMGIVLLEIAASC